MPRHTIHLQADAEAILQELAIEHNGNLSEAIASTLVRYAALTQAGPELLRAAILEMESHPSEIAREKLAASISLTSPSTAAQVIAKTLIELREQARFTVKTRQSKHKPS